MLLVEGVRGEGGGVGVVGNKSEAGAGEVSDDNYRVETEQSAAAGATRCPTPTQYILHTSPASHVFTSF